MEWTEIASAVKKYAPVLANVVGTVVPGAGAVGTGISLIASAFGVEDEDPKPEQILKAIQADPEAAIKLRKIEAENQQALASIALKQEEMRLQDVQGARQRQLAHEKVTGGSDVNLYVLAWTVIGGFFGLMALLCFRDLPADSNGVVFLLFGSLATGFGQVLAYFFGSSAGSQKKSAMLAEQTVGKK